MPAQSRLSAAAQDALRCPICRARLVAQDERLACTDPGCGAMFPVIDGVPILLNERASVFAIDDFVARRDTTFNLGKGRLRTALGRLTPSISRNVKAERNYARLTDLLVSAAPAPVVLVVGGSIQGQGTAALTDNRAVALVETDVSFGPRTQLVCDGHDLPFADATFDGVIVQAVLEHVVDPARCVAEIHRVLKPQGLVYAETPFMQQVHGGRYDFTRFTHLGHRRLFRQFAEVESGAVCGPGMALAWAYQYFLLSFTASGGLRTLLRVFASFTAFWLKYFDSYLIDKPGALDAASGYYFIGRKSEQLLSDRELLNLYRGAVA